MSRGLEVVRAELEAWEHAWSQIELFLDRIGELADKDAPHRDRLYALLKVAAVLERNEPRQGRIALEPPLLPERWSDDGELPAGPPALRLRTLRPTLAGQLPDLASPSSVPLEVDSIVRQLPGAADVEVTVAQLRMKGKRRQVEEADLAQVTMIQAAEVVPRVGAEPEDPEAATEVHEVPHYDIPWTGLPEDFWKESEEPAEAEAEDGIPYDEGGKELGFLSGQARQDLVFTRVTSRAVSWAQRRTERRAVAADGLGTPLTDELLRYGDGEEVLVSPHLRPDRAWFPPRPDALAALWDRADSATEVEPTEVQGGEHQAEEARFAAGACRRDAAAIQDARDALEEVAPEELLTRLTTLAREFERLTGAWEDLRTLLEQERIDSQELLALPVVSTAALNLALADLARELPDDADLAPVGGQELAGLDRQIQNALDARTAYPDGTLRLQRIVEWTFLTEWWFRQRWFALRGGTTLRPVLRSFLKPYYRSLSGLLSGEGSRFPTPAAGIVVARPVPALSQELPLKAPVEGAELLPVSGVRAGHVAVVRGDRPALGLVVRTRPVPGGTQALVTAPLNPSSARGAGLPGVPSLIDEGSVVDDGAGLPFEDHELARGERWRGGRRAPAEDALPRDLISLWSRLALLEGWERVDATIGRPFPTPYRPEGPRDDLELEVVGPVSINATKLVLKPLPEDRFDGDQALVARPGELLLLRGLDADGQLAQGVVELDDVSLTTEAALEAETGADFPICCRGAGDVAVLALRNVRLPVRLESHVVLHRRFQGFGVASLACGALLPEALDADPRSTPPVFRGDRADEPERFVLVEEKGSAVAGPPAVGLTRTLDRSPELEEANRMLLRLMGSTRR